MLGICPKLSTELHAHLVSHAWMHTMLLLTPCSTHGEYKTLFSFLKNTCLQSWQIEGVDEMKRRGSLLLGWFIYVSDNIWESVCFMGTCIARRRTMNVCCGFRNHAPYSLKEVKWTTRPRKPCPKKCQESCYMDFEGEV